MNADQKNQLIGNIVSAMKTVPKEIQEGEVAHFCKADRPTARVWPSLGVSVPKAA
jgi:catalase